jgi:[acyl-carrier-protein] S-malonyltransferase
MGKIAVVFSGQGAQYSGMGRDLAENSSAAYQVFKMADKIRPGTSKQCFEGTKEELMQTENTQPCIFCVGYGAAAALKERGIKADFTAGFSMGEVAALAYGGCFTGEEAFSIIIKRAAIMHESGKKNPGIMFAVLGLNSEQVIKLCKENKGWYPVNFNGETQISVACTEDSATGFPEAVIKCGGRAVKLPVSGGFHSPMMKDAREKMVIEFQNLLFKTGDIPVYSNVTAEPYKGKEEFFAQVDSPVLWYQLIKNMSRDGVDTFIEAGPGKTLSNMISKILPDALVLNVEDSKSLENTVEVLKNAQQ